MVCKKRWPIVISCEKLRLIEYPHKGSDPLCGLFPENDIHELGHVGDGDFVVAGKVAEGAASNARYGYLLSDGLGVAIAVGRGIDAYVVGVADGDLGSMRRGVGERHGAVEDGSFGRTGEADGRPSA